MATGSTSLALAHREVQARLRGLTARQVGQIWAALGTYDERDVPRFLAAALPMVAAAQRQSVRVTEAYLARSVGRTAPGISPGRAVGPAARNGADPAEVYRRPFVEVWSALGSEVPFEQARKRGLDRLLSTAETDVQLSSRSAVREFAEAEPRIYGWQRVVGDGCDLCRIASTQRYRTDQLMPIHSRCGCTVAPIYEPTGRVIDRVKLRELKAEGAVDRITAQRAKARKVELRGDLDAVAVRDHGELGPVLTDAKHDFTAEVNLG